jgi:signal transduction histidine kinase
MDWRDEGNLGPNPISDAKRSISETKRLIATLRQSEQYVQSLIAHLNEYLHELESRTGGTPNPNETLPRPDH